MTITLFTAPTAASHSTTASAAATCAATNECETPFCKLDPAVVAPVAGWGAVPARPAFAAGEVHLWRTRLDGPSASTGEWLRHLSRDERDRANRFRFESDSRRFIAARGFLRVTLGRYLERAPDGLVFAYGAHGKPRLVPDPGEGPWHFNLAHTDTLAVFAVARDRAVGVDAERVRPIAEAVAVAERFFSPRERAWLGATPPEEKAEAFLRIWTRKEACAKAVGRGLEDGLNQLDLAEAADGRPRTFLVPRGTRRAVEGVLVEFDLASDHVAALAVLAAGD